MAAKSRPRISDIVRPVADWTSPDVARGRHPALHVDPLVGERALAAIAAGLHRARELRRVVDHLHADAAATAGRLHQDGKADACSLRLDGREIAGRDRTVAPRRGLDADTARDGACLDLVAEGLERSRRWTDEHDSGAACGGRERRVLRQEAIAGMNGVGACRDGRLDDGAPVEVALLHRRRAEPHRRVRRLHVWRVRVGIGVDGDRLDAQAVAGPLDAAGNLAAVRDEDSFQHDHPVAHAFAGVKDMEI